MKNQCVMNRKIFKFFQNRIKIAMQLLSAVSIFLFGDLSLAQMSPPPTISMTDEVGVDLVSWLPFFSLNDLKIGNGVSTLSHTISTYDATWTGSILGFRDNYRVGAQTAGFDNHVYMLGVSGQKSQRFDGNIYVHPSLYRANKDDGATLVEGVNGLFTYTTNDGTVITTQSPSLTTMIYPNGLETRIYYNSGRILSVNTNTGLQFKYIYGSNGLVSNVIAINNAVEYCDISAPNCLLTKVWPKTFYSWPAGADGVGEFKVTDALGRVTSYTQKAFSLNMDGRPPFTPRVVSVKDFTNPNSPFNRTFDYDNATHCIADPDAPLMQCVVERFLVTKKATLGGYRINSSTPVTDERSWTYEYIPYNQWASRTTSKGPRGYQEVNFMTENLTSFSTPDGVSATVINDLVTAATIRGKSFSYKYDGRRNLIEEAQTDGATTLVTSAVFPATCTNLKTCNKPISVTDANSQTTNYTYYEENGQVKSVKMPPDKNGVRAETRYKYSALYAYYKDANNTFARAASPVWMLTDELSCSESTFVSDTNDNCIQTDKQLLTHYDYGPASGPNNLWLRGVEKTANGKTLRTCYQYDNYGNVITEVSPKAGLTSCSAGGF